MKTELNLKVINNRIVTSMVISLFFITTACESLKTAVFDQYAYQQAISLKIESTNLMENAINPFASFQSEIDELELELQKMVEYEKNKPNNEITYAMWTLVMDSERNLLAGFLKRWETEGQLSQTFTNEAIIQISEALDLIIKYEAQKNKTNESNILNFLSNN
ncbi:hypothetical protein SAMN04487989_102155 [Bizionia echini]|uniref:Uncharacterized protein n=1 Tax=Bizionia echini TaxID=649333 RepID=A0A1I5AMB0_9FLAO|nr:hypothetical protein [Bizionia echini]SFN63555.1 hypothetical protein SAMN04487989_102155 [Bizionia echini]